MFRGKHEQTIRVAILGVMLLLAGFELAASAVEGDPAPVIGFTAGRARATVAAVLALIGVIIGGIALARASRRIGSGAGKRGAIAALVFGPIGMLLGAFHLATATGAIGTGSGRAGAIVAVVLGLIGIILGRLALTRSRRTKN